MERKSLLCLTVCATVLLIGAQYGWARSVTGTATLKLKKPLTTEVNEQMRAMAIGNFRIDLWEWMKEEADVTVDTTNAIQRFHFLNYGDSCINKAKIDAALVGHDASVTISISGDEARTLLETYNTRCYSISLRYYTLMKKALEDRSVTDLYNLGIQTIYYTMGRMGTPIGIPDESTPRSFLLEESRKIMQNFFNKFSVRSQEVIILGKPGTVLPAPLKVQVIIDTLPLTNIAMAGVLPGGKKICSGKTGADGSVWFNDFKIPFVSKGSMLYLKPDMASVVMGAAPFDAADLGITIPEQTMVFNIVPATFSLVYKTNAVNKVDIPKDFASDAFIKKFLQDSCFLSPASPGGQPDLYITFLSQVSNYSHDELEQTVLKVENDITIEDASRKTLAKKQAVAFEKAYENSIQIPMGLFFWEAAAKSSRMIKEMFRGL